MADVKITALPAIASVALADVIPIVDDVAGTPATTKATITQVRAALVPIVLTADVSGVLPVANGGTGISSMGFGVATFLGTPSGANLGAALTTPLAAAKVVQATGTGIPHVALGVLSAASSLIVDADVTDVGLAKITGLGSNVAAALATFSSANIKTACTDETGSGGALVFATSPTLTTPIINGQIIGATVAISAMAIDWTLGTVFTKTLAGGANTFTFSNQASGMVITVRVTGAVSTLTWPTVLWAGGVAPTQTGTGTDVYTFVHDGTSIYGSVVQAMA